MCPGSRILRRVPCGEGDFRECIICFTSNAQRKELVDLKSSYRRSGRDTGDTAFQNAIRDVLTRADIAPEICGRINRFFVYNPLTPDAVFRIAMAEMQKIARSYELELVSGDPELLAEIALSTTGSPYGARPITRRIENTLGTPLLQFKHRFPDETQDFVYACFAFLCIDIVIVECSIDDALAAAVYFHENTSIRRFACPVRT